MMKLTGRKRHRVQPGGRFRSPTLVLQVEEAGHVTECYGGLIDSYPVRRWRDATVEDLTIEPAQEIA